MSRTTVKFTNRIDRRAGQQGSRPSVRGQAEVEKYVTGRHYSGVASPGWPKPKRLRTRSKNNNKSTQFHRTVSIGSINTTTMKDPMKFAQCIAQCKALGHSLTFIQETHMIGNRTIPFKDPELCGWRFINSGLKGKAQDGVGIALSPDVELVDIDNILNGRILLVRCILHGIKISAFCAYAPTELYADSTKDNFFNKLNQAIQKVKREFPGFKVLIGADMNATIGDDSFGPWEYLGPNNDQLETNDNGTRLLSISNENKLFLMNTLFPSKAIHRHTWYSPTGFTKRLDYILAEWHLKKLCTNCRVYRKASVPFETNHRLLAMSCSFPSKRKQKQFFSRISKPPKPHKNVSSLYNDSEVCKEFSNQLDVLLADDPPTNDINLLENILTDSIINASESKIPKILPSNKKSPWVDDEFLSLTKARRTCKDPGELKTLSKAIKKMRNKLKNEYFSSLANDINTAAEARKIEEEFRLCKTYTMHKNTDTNLISSEKLTDFFKDHLKEKPIDLQPEVLNPELFPHIIPPDNIAPNSDLPTEKEVEDARKRFKNGKCQGTDKIYGEELKYNFSGRFLIYLMLLINTVWTSFTIPSSWLISSITCLFKNKGSRSEAKNYRGLSIMATCSKIIISIVISRIRDTYENIISNCQFGFRSNRSTTDAIFILQNAINISPKPLYICFIDLKAAYDWINRDMLFKILEIRIKSPILVNILKVFYTGTSAAIKGSKVFFQTFTGCRQGGLESPVLFNIYMDFVLRCAEHEVLQKFPNTGLEYSYRIPGHCSTREQRSIYGLSGTQHLRMILYADDIAVLSNNADELAEILRIYDKTFTRFGLKIATDKTETMAFNVSEEIKSLPSLFSLGGVPIKNVREFKYLGHMENNTDDDPSLYLNFRISSAYQKWNELKHVFTDKRIFMSTRIKLLEACVRSRLLYSCQSWELSANELRKLESIWYSFLRKMVTNGYKRKNVPPEYLKARKEAKKSGKTLPEPDDLDWAYFYDNETLRKITKTTNISSFCKIQHLKYIAHVTRLDNSSLQKQLLFSSTQKKYARDPWIKAEKDLNISKMQIQKTMQNKTEFMSLLHHVYNN